MTGDYTDCLYFRRAIRSASGVARVRTLMARWGTSSVGHAAPAPKPALTLFGKTDAKTSGRRKTKS